MFGTALCHFTFLAEGDFSEEYKTEVNSSISSFNSQLNTVIKSIKISDRRGEHTKLKPHQLMSGFLLSVAPDWTLEENGRGPFVLPNNSRDE